MNRNMTLRLAGILVIFVLFWTHIVAQDNLALTTARLNARTGPGVAFDVLTTLPQSTTVAVLGRNNGGDWLLVRPVDSQAQAWIARAYVSLPDTLDVGALPVSDAAGGATLQEAAPSAEVPPVAAGSGGGLTISNLNVRSGPGTNNTTITKVLARTRVIIESRNEVGDWIVIRTPDNAIRGWVSTRYVNFDDDVSLHTLPISTEIAGQASASSVEEASPPVAPNTGPIEIPVIDPNSFTLPQGDVATLTQRLDAIPLFYNFNTGQVYNIFRNGKQLGNRPNVFMKVGDSVTAVQPFLIAYGEGNNYDLGTYGYLQDTINYFNTVSPRTGIANSFTNPSFAAFTGATAGSMLSTLFADRTFCVEQTPLSCEINLTRPSVGLILFGTQDIRIVDARNFRIQLAQMVEYMISQGVIPVLSTFHNNPSYYGADAVIFNNVIVDVSEAYGVPLINLWKATQPLPDNGVMLSDPVHLTMGWQNSYDLTGEENEYGVNMRNLVTLQALDQLRKTVLQG